MLANSESFKELEEETQALGVRLKNKILEAAKTGELSDPKRALGALEKIQLESEFQGAIDKLDGVRKDLVNNGFKFDELTKGWTK